METSTMDNLQQTIEHHVKNHKILYVKQKQGDDFVVINAQDWRAIEETLFLNQIPELIESIQEVRKEPLEQGIPLKDLNW